MKNVIMMKLNSSFQQEVFRRVLTQYRNSKKAGRILGIPASSLRGYKNLYFHHVPQRIINLLLKRKIITKKELSANLTRVLNQNERIHEILNAGREVRRDQFKKLKAKIPSPTRLIKKGYLDLKQWLYCYYPLLKTPFRNNIKIITKKKYMILSYRNFTRQGFKEFTVKIPHMINIDNDFLYFLGLWCGDRAGGKRLGISNKNEQIIQFSEEFLERYYQKVERILLITKGMAIPNLFYDKKFELNNKIKGWVVSIHSNNGILSSFFYHLQSYLDKFLGTIEIDLSPFFAGLFDAEGNVSLYNKSFRWACQNPGLVAIYSKYLAQKGLYNRYDGSCIIAYNLSSFYNNIFPFLRHPEKRNLTSLLCKGKGQLPTFHEKVLRYVHEFPKSTQKEIAKGLKANKVYSELRLLSNFEYLTMESYPYTFQITAQGSKLLGI